MDDKKLKQAAAAVYLWIAESRKAHRQAMKQFRAEGSFHGRDARDRAATMHARLTYLVPLHRALHCAAQQDLSVAGGGKGAKLYGKRFWRLKHWIRESVLYAESGLKEKLFGDGLLRFPILVPDDDVPSGQWQFRPIGELIEEDAAELEASRQARYKLWRDAESSRKRFLDSLTIEQSSLLRQALDVAEAKGAHAVNFSLRDLEAR